MAKAYVLFAIKKMGSNGKDLIFSYPETGHQRPFIASCRLRAILQISLRPSEMRVV